MIYGAGLPAGTKWQPPHFFLFAKDAIVCKSPHYKLSPVFPKRLHYISVLLTAKQTGVVFIYRANKYARPIKGTAELNKTYKKGNLCTTFANAWENVDCQCRARKIFKSSVIYGELSRDINFEEFIFRWGRTVNPRNVCTKHRKSEEKIRERILPAINQCTLFVWGRWLVFVNKEAATVSCKISSKINNNVTDAMLNFSMTFNVSVFTLLQ